MNDNEFRNFVVEKLLDIEKRLTTLEEARRQEIKLIKAMTLILSLIMAKFGIDISGILGG